MHAQKLDKSCLVGLLYVPIAGILQAVSYISLFAPLLGVKFVHAFIIRPLALQLPMVFNLRWMGGFSNVPVALAIICGCALRRTLPAQNSQTCNNCRCRPAAGALCYSPDKAGLSMRGLPSALPEEREVPE